MSFKGNRYQKDFEMASAFSTWLNGLIFPFCGCNLLGNVHLCTHVNYADMYT